jgi:hypothetical protein
MVIGAILAPGQRTVTAILRIVGLSQEGHFQDYHRVLNRAVWSSLDLSQVLLRLLLDTFVPQGPIVLGLDDTIERRQGAQIKAKGIYRDPVRSSHSHFVKASGLCWLCVMWLTEIPWAHAVWALPFLTALCPSERYDQDQERHHKTLIDWAIGLLLQVRHWLPGRLLVVVADNSFAVIDLLLRVATLKEPICMIVRFRLDAALYEPAPERKAGQAGRPRKKGKRLPTLESVAADPHTAWQSVSVPNWYGQPNRTVEIVSSTAVWYHSGKAPLPIRWVLIRDPRGKFKTQALLCTDQNQNPVQILLWFVRRWRVEVTFHEVRTHLGGRDPTPMVGRGHCAYHADLAGFIFAGHLVGPSTDPHGTALGPPNGLVYQRAPYLLGCLGGGSRSDLADATFINLTPADGYTKNNLCGGPILAGGFVLFSLKPGSLDKV